MLSFLLLRVQQSLPYKHLNTSPAPRRSKTPFFLSNSLDESHSIYVLQVPKTGYSVSLLPTNSFFHILFLYPYSYSNSSNYLLKAFHINASTFVLLIRTIQRCLGHHAHWYHNFRIIGQTSASLNTTKSSFIYTSTRKYK